MHFQPPAASPVRVRPHFYVEKILRVRPREATAGPHCSINDDTALPPQASSEAAGQSRLRSAWRTRTFLAGPGWLATRDQALRQAPRDSPDRVGKGRRTS